MDNLNVQRLYTEALSRMLSEYSINELLDMLQFVGDCYLECSDGGVNMTIIHQQRTLEKFLKELMVFEEEFHEANIESKKKGILNASSL